MKRVLIAALILLSTAGAVFSQAVPSDDVSLQMNGGGDARDPHLRVQYNAPDANGNDKSIHSFVKFDLSVFPSNLPAQNIQKATLILYVEKGGTIGSTTGHITVCQLGANWTSTSVTGTTAPACATGVSPVSFAITAAQIKNGSFVTVDVTPIVQNWYLGQGNFGFGLFAEPPITGTGQGINVEIDSIQDGGSGYPSTLNLVLQSQGPQGIPGAAATVQIGSVTTAPSGSAASVTNSGTSSNAVLNFAIPQGVAGAASTVPGPVGPSGASATIQVGTVASVPAGSPPSVVNSGTANAAVLNFTIPQGSPGLNGKDSTVPGPVGPASTVPGPAGQDGVSVTGAPEPAGANCQYGGVRLTASNGAFYACNGLVGSNGSPGQAGAAGRSPFQGTWDPTRTDYQAGDEVFRPTVIVVNGQNVPGYGTRGPFFSVDGTNTIDPAADAAQVHWVYAGVGPASTGYTPLNTTGTTKGTGVFLSHQFNADETLTITSLSVSITQGSGGTTQVTETCSAGVFRSPDDGSIQSSGNGSCFSAPFNCSVQSSSFSTITMSCSGGSPQNSLTLGNPTLTVSLTVQNPPPENMSWSVTRNDNPVLVIQSIGNVNGGTSQQTSAPLTPAGTSITFKPGDTIKVIATDGGTNGTTTGSWSVN